MLGTTMYSIHKPKKPSVPFYFLLLLSLPSLYYRFFVIIPLGLCSWSCDSCIDTQETENHLHTSSKIDLRRLEGLGKSIQKQGIDGREQGRAGRRMEGDKQAGYHGIRHFYQNKNLLCHIHPLRSCTPHLTVRKCTKKCSKEMNHTLLGTAQYRLHKLQML